MKFKKTFFILFLNKILTAFKHHTMANITYVEALRNFTSYFYDKYRLDLSKINERSFSTGFFNKSLKNIDHFNVLKEKIGTNLSLNSFFQFIHDIYEDFSTDGNNLKDFHLKKENICIVNFLPLVINFRNQIPDCESLNEYQIRTLKDIYIKFNTAFTNNFEHFENLIINRVDETLNERLSQNNLLSSQTDQVFGNNRSSINQISNLIEDNHHDFNQIKNLVFKSLKFKSHRAVNKIHKNQCSVPEKQSFYFYPKPWLEEDEDYVTEYNAIIRDAQEKTMNLMSKYIDKRIEKFNSEINSKLETLKEKDIYKDQDLREALNFITNKAENSKYMKIFYIKSRRKANSCPKIESYQIIDLKGKNVNSSNASIEDQSVTSSKSSYKSNRRVSIRTPNKSILKRSNSRNSNNISSNYSPNDNYPNNNKYNNNNNNNNNNYNNNNNNTYQAYRNQSDNTYMNTTLNTQMNRNIGKYQNDQSMSNGGYFNNNYIPNHNQNLQNRQNYRNFNDSYISNRNVLQNDFQRPNNDYRTNQNFRGRSSNGPKW